MATGYALWAPHAHNVDLCLGEDRIALRQAPDGWWYGGGARRPGERYAFSVDGGAPRPDPRSNSQPDGVHAFSAVVDHDHFGWTDENWAGFTLAGSVLYELHVGTFSPEGTFDGVIARLDHLVDLGVDAIEVMPVAEFPGGHGWGYDGVNLYAPRQAYGGPEGLKRLVDACHRVGLAVVLDVVYNHLGPAGNYLGEFAPYFTDRYSTAWGTAVNVDGPESDEVRRWIVDNALMWFRDYHVDALRLDAVHAIVDTSARHVLEQLADEVAALSRRLDRPMTLIAESDRNDPRLALPAGVGGLGLDGIWSDDWHHALHATLTGEREGFYADFDDPSLLAKALAQGWAYDGGYSVFRRRSHGRSPAQLMDHQFIVCVQNHDQIGNRACGERIVTLTSFARARLAAALLLTTPFTPLLFQGEEWGSTRPFQYFTDHDDPQLADAIRIGRRAEFAAHGTAPEEVPDPQAPATFARSVLDWSEPAQGEHAVTLDWYRQLIALRRSHPDLGAGKAAVSAQYDAGSGLVRVERGTATVVANLGADELAVRLGSTSTVLASSGPGVTQERQVLHLPANSVAILQRADGANC